MYVDRAWNMALPVLCATQIRFPEIKAAIKDAPARRTEVLSERVAVD
jgi:hypothetical protein